MCSESWCCCCTQTADCFFVSLFSLLLVLWHLLCGVWCENVNKEFQIVRVIIGCMSRRCANFYFAGYLLWNSPASSAEERFQLSRRTTTTMNVCLMAQNPTQTQDPRKDSTKGEFSLQPNKFDVQRGTMEYTEVLSFLHSVFSLTWVFVISFLVPSDQQVSMQCLIWLWLLPNHSILFKLSCLNGVNGFSCCRWSRSSEHIGLCRNADMESCSSALCVSASSYYHYRRHVNESISSDAGCSVCAYYRQENRNGFIQ